MSEFDLIIRGGTVVTAAGSLPADIGVAGGVIAALGPALSGSVEEEIDASGLHIFPGVIDSHLHFNDPGRSDWEGLETGSRALAAGGGTLFFDMPLNAHPPTVDAESFRLKLAEAERKSLVDFAFWGGLVPGNVEHLPELAECGVVGFKAFMCASGIHDFLRVDDDTLRAGMTQAAQLRRLVAVHAESEPLTRQLTQERLAAGRTSIRDYLDSRPVKAELEAIGRAIGLAGETGCALHIVHVSCGEGIRLVVEARKRGVDVSCETCPHYLVLTAEDMVTIGATAKCAPPLRSRAEQEDLWQHLMAGDINTVGSDHSPSPPGMKADTDFFKVWGGISSVQHTLPLLLTEAYWNREAHRSAGRSEDSLGHDGHEVLPLLARLLSENVAARFKLPPSKGCMAVGADADFALVDLEQAGELRTADLLYRHQQTPYAGRRLQGCVVRTILRGRTVFAGGKICSEPLGCLVKPLP